MTWIVLPQNSVDLWVYNPSWCVLPISGVTGRSGWALCAVGRLGPKDHTRMAHKPAWQEVRAFESLADASHLCELLSRGEVSPEDAVAWMAPVAQQIGEVVETVADLHRRRRRRGPW